MRNLLTLTCLSLILLSACKDDDNAEPTPSNNGGGSGAMDYTLAESDAVLTTYRSRSLMNGIASHTTAAYAVFLDEFDQGTNVGQVFLNGTELNDTLIISGIPVYLGHGYYAADESMGLDISGEPMAWSVTSGGGYPDFAQTINDITFPVVDTVNSSGIIDKSDGYTLSCAAISGADSVTFSLSMGPQRTVAGNVASCTFAASELAGMPVGVSNVNITASVFSGRNISGKKVNFTKLTSTRRTVQVVN